MLNFCKNYEFCSCKNKFLQRSCGILCSDSSIFEVLLCHINNFSSFTLINIWWREFDFISYLFKFLFKPSKFCIIIREIFALFFREIFAFFAIFFGFFCENFAFSSFAKILHFFAKEIDTKFREKSENSHSFHKRTKCKAKGSRKKHNIFPRSNKVNYEHFGIKNIFYDNQI